MELLDTQKELESQRCGLLSYAQAYGSLKGCLSLIQDTLEWRDRFGPDDVDASHVALSHIRQAVQQAQQTINTFSQQQ